MRNNSTSEMRNLKSKKLYLQVYDELCNYIRDNNLSPGDKMPTEAAMTTMLGVSRNILREAIKALEIAGVVTSKPGVGITICKNQSDLLLTSLLSQINAMSDDKAKENIEEIRCILEISFCKKAFDCITETQLSVLEQQVDIMRVATEKARKDEQVALDTSFVQADALFHSTLYSETGNILLGAILGLFWSTDTYFKEKTHHDSLEVTFRNHKRIFNALKSRDFEEYKSAMHQHFSNFQKIIDNEK